MRSLYAIARRCFANNGDPAYGVGEESWTAADCSGFINLIIKSFFGRYSKYYPRSTMDQYLDYSSTWTIDPDNGPKTATEILAGELNYLGNKSTNGDWRFKLPFRTYPGWAGVPIARGALNMSYTGDTSDVNRHGCLFDRNGNALSMEGSGLVWDTVANVISRGLHNYASPRYRSAHFNVRMLKDMGENLADGA